MTEANVKLTLVHTNDLHSHFEETARVAGFVARVRREVPDERLLLLDCGDFLDRVRMETEGTDGAANRAVLEYLGYDAVMLGNNEGLTYTPEQLDELFRDMAMPVVCANMTRGPGDFRPGWLVPTMKLDKAGLRIGLVGVTAPFTDYYDLLGWNAADPIATVRQAVAELRPEVDALIVLSHLGLKQDERLAASVDGLDLILGGHTHHLLEKPIRVGSATIAAAGKFGQHVGRLELEFAPDGRLVSIEGGCSDTAAIAPDPGLERVLAPYRRKAGFRMAREIARLAEPLEAPPFAESPLATLLACGIRRETGAELALVNAGQLLEGLGVGPVTEARIHAICPSPINPCLMGLTGAQIRRTLEESLLPDFYELEIRGFGFRGRVLGRLCVDGMEIAANLSKPPYEKIAGVRIGGAPLDDNRVYRVGTLDMFTFGVGYAGLKQGADVRYFLPDFIRTVLAKALNDDNLVKVCRKPRWLVGD